MLFYELRYWCRQRFYPSRLMNWWRYRGTEPFIVTKIKKGVVTAVQIDRDTGEKLTGDKFNVVTFDHRQADYLQTGDITVLGR